MKRYRIIIETEANGKKWYYVQKRYMFLFWCYLTEVRDITMYAYKIGWESLEEAEMYIKLDMNTTYENEQKKIVKREYVYY